MIERCWRFKQGQDWVFERRLENGWGEQDQSQSLEWGGSCSSTGGSGRWYFNLHFPKIVCSLVFLPSIWNQEIKFPLSSHSVTFLAKSGFSFEGRVLSTVTWHNSGCRHNQQRQFYFYTFKLNSVLHSEI